MVEKLQALTGYRALDLSGPMGVYRGKLMADMGADVIKVEPPGPAPMRRVPRHQSIKCEAGAAPRTS